MEERKIQATSRGAGVAEILKRISVSRDPEAWQALLEGHGQAMLGLARRISGDATLAEDICQETLLQIRDDAHQFRPLSADADVDARRWISRVTCHTALQMLRARRRAVRREERLQRERQQTPRNALGPEMETLEAVRSELANLPEHERMPIVLHFYAGLDYQALSAELGCPVGTAKARVSRGLDRLRQRLAFLGLILAAGELADVMQGSSVEAAEAVGGSAVAAHASADAMALRSLTEGGQAAVPVWEPWKALLTSSRKPAPDLRMLKGGLSTMAKLGISTAALGLLSALAFGMGHSFTGVAGEPKSAPPPASKLPSQEAAGKASKEEVKSLVQGNTAFALDVYAKLKAEKGNLFFSPYSISGALAMTCAGARGNTAAQMEQSLHFTLGQARLHPAFAALLLEQNSPPPKGKKRGYQLSVANALWGQKGYGFLPEFLSLTRAHYGAGLNEVDFLGATEAARVTINAWVERQTQEKIKDLLQPGVLDENTRLVLTNAIYFKGAWACPFEKEATAEAPFQLSPTEKVNVPLMNQTAPFKYFEAAGLQVLELPYAENELSMVIFLPSDLQAFESSFTPRNLQGWLARLKPCDEVAVSIPKFKATQEFRLNAVLKALGMSDAFSGAADFSGMNGKKDLCIAAVVQKAFAEVNEEGTEAVAATADIEKGLLDDHEPLVFRADRPFVFMIRDLCSESVLFLGRMLDPRSK